MLVRRDLLIADPVHPHQDLGSGSSLDHMQAASIRYRIAIGPHAGRKALTLNSLPPAEDNSDIPLLAYSVEKLDVEVGDSATLSSKSGLHSG